MCHAALNAATQPIENRTQNTYNLWLDIIACSTTRLVFWHKCCVLLLKDQNLDDSNGDDGEEEKN